VGKTGSERQAVKAALLTQNGHLIVATEVDQLGLTQFRLGQKMFESSVRRNLSAGNLVLA
jgi:hypothetical protein